MTRKVFCRACNLWKRFLVLRLFPESYLSPQILLHCIQYSTKCPGKILDGEKVVSSRKIHQKFRRFKDIEFLGSRFVSWSWCILLFFKFLWYFWAGYCIHWSNFFNFPGISSKKYFSWFLFIFIWQGEQGDFRLKKY